jgi:hypothetical protein
MQNSRATGGPVFGQQTNVMGEHVSVAVHVPQATSLPHPSLIDPHETPAAAQVVGTQGVIVTGTATPWLRKPSTASRLRVTVWGGTS